VNSDGGIHPRIKSLRPTKNGGSPGANPAAHRREFPKALRWRLFALGFGTTATLCCIAFAAWTAAWPTTISPAVESFWQPFFQSAQPPVIVFSNHRFAGSSASGLHYFREGIDSPQEANDTYSGTGTLMAVGELSSLFSLRGHSARLKRAELLTWDEARDVNLVFVGAPEANSRLREMAPL
jgi:hypothetical protein